MSKPYLQGTGYHILQAYKHAHNILSAYRLRPCLQRLDNKSLHALITFFNSEGVGYQINPVHSHQWNATE